LLELQAKLQELEMQGVDGAPSAQPSEVEDEVLLKLKVYRSLGIDAERGEDGEWSRAVVRGRGRETQIVNVEKKFSRFFYANYFWGAL
jgi:kinetochore protein Spc24